MLIEIEMKEIKQQEVNDENKEDKVKIEIDEIVKEDCPICLGEITEGNVKTDNQIKCKTNDNKEIIVTIDKTCNHSFHKDCLVEWLKIKKECPLCRNKIFLYILDDVKYLCCNNRCSTRHCTTILSLYLVLFLAITFTVSFIKYMD